MQPQDLSTILPIVVPLTIALILLLKPKRERALNVDKLWIVPVIVTAMIGMGLAFTPHDPFGPVAWLGFVAAAILGGGAGWWRAKTVRMRYDVEVDRIMARSSNFAVLALVILMAARGAARMWLETADLGIDIGAVTDAFLIFAIALVIGQRIEMWVRARRLSGVARPHAGGPAQRPFEP